MFGKRTFGFGSTVLSKTDGDRKKEYDVFEIMKQPPPPPLHTAADAREGCEENIIFSLENIFRRIVT